MKVIGPMTLRLSRFCNGSSRATFAQMAILMRTPDVRTFFSRNTHPWFLLTFSYVYCCSIYLYRGVDVIAGPPRLPQPFSGNVAVERIVGQCNSP